MTCASCSANVERAVKKVPGVEHVDVSLLNNTMKVDYNDEETNPSQIMAAVDAIGYGATLKEQGNTASKNSMPVSYTHLTLPTNSLV